MGQAHTHLAARYEHGGNVYAHPACTDFSANLNPLGMPEAAREALRASVDAFSCYPDPACTDLLTAIAEFEKVPSAWVVPCAGATDAFERICQVSKPKGALLCAPCYAGYEQALRRAGAAITYHALHAARGFDVGLEIVETLDANKDLVFLANPNNPTGRCVRRDVLLACLEKARSCNALVVLDECFIDLTDCEGSNDLLERFPHLVIVKAFTKSFALAGLRLGYALCADESLTQRLWQAGQMWAVSVPAQIAGVACASCTDHLRRSRRLIAQERARLRDALLGFGLKVVEGQANYLLFEGPELLGDELLKRGLLVRSCANFYGLDERWWRIAVRTPGENDLLIGALWEVLK